VKPLRETLDTMRDDRNAWCEQASKALGGVATAGQFRSSPAVVASISGLTVAFGVVTITAGRS
jgi:hypothetical protein